MSDRIISTARGGFASRLIAALLVVATLAVGTGFYFADGRDPVRAVAPETSSAEGQDPKTKTPPASVGGVPLFIGWPKENPDAVIVLSGQTNGYMQPCGCSRPQLGGLERRYNFIQSLRARNWPVVALDLGDLTPEKGVREQTHKKYEYTMRSLKAMNYAAVGVGQYEFAQQLFELLARFTLNNDDKPPYLLAANLVGGVQRDAQGKAVRFQTREKIFAGVPGARPMVEDVEMITPSKTLPLGLNGIGVVGTVGPSVAAKVVKLDQEIDFESNSRILAASLAKIAAHPAKPELRVLLYQGSVEEAQKIAEDFPTFEVIVCLSEDSEPPQNPIVKARPKGESTLILQLGHKGRYVGVLGVFKTKEGIELKYQLVPLGEEYLTAATPAAEQANPVLQLIEKYAVDVKNDDLLSLYNRNKIPHPAQIKHAKDNPTYVGSDACRKCHAAEFAVWSKTRHAHAYVALEEAKRPSLQQFNGECVVCHTTGFKYASGYQSKEKTPHLLHNGCENCHGPGSAHVAKPNQANLIAEMVPWRVKPTDKLPTKEFMEKMAKLDGNERIRLESKADAEMISKVSKMCIQCHDSENDPKFDFYKYMPQIYHSGLKAQGLPPGIGK